MQRTKGPTESWGQERPSWGRNILGRASRVTAGMREGSKREVLGEIAAVAAAEATGKNRERGPC